jgi:hypothetical protein
MIFVAVEDALAIYDFEKKVRFLITVLDGCRPIELNLEISILIANRRAKELVAILITIPRFDGEIGKADVSCFINCPATQL